MRRSWHSYGLLVGLASVATVKAIAQGAGPGAPIMPAMPSLRYTNVAPGVTLHQSSPVLYFRGILGMTPAEREKALAKKPPAARAALLEKVHEYGAMSNDVREARLRLTELQWELTTLTTLGPTNQIAFIKESPAEDRPILDKWRQFQSFPPNQQRTILDAMIPAGPPALTVALDQWQAVPEPDRQQASGQFLQIMYLNRDRQQETLNSFSESDRKTMEAALTRFAALPDAQRKVCIASFQKFASMDATERDEFLKNAARWESMTPNERQLWQTLVQKMPIMPPSPPGMIRSVQFPPMPPGMILYPPSPPGMKTIAAPASGNQ